MSGARERSGNRLALVVTVAILLAGLVGAVLVVVLTRATTTPAATASVAAPPSFGASLPISTPAPSGSASSASSSTSATAGIEVAQLRDPAAVDALLAAATTAIQTVDSYDYRHLAADRAAGDAASTGAFRTRYDASLAAIAASAPRTRAVQLATVQKIAVTSLSADGTSAGVLVFGRLLITDSTHPDPISAALTSGVGLVRTAGRWQVSDTVDLGDHGTYPTTPPGNAALLAATTAAGAEVVDLLSYSRTDFDADFNRAMDGLSDLLRRQRASVHDSLRDKMNQAQLDYAGVVRSIGVESASGSAVLLLVCATGYQVSAQSGGTVSGTQRIEVGVTFTRGRWLVSEYLSLPDPA